MLRLTWSLRVDCNTKPLPGGLQHGLGAVGGRDVVDSLAVSVPRRVGAPPEDAGGLGATGAAAGAMTRLLVFLPVSFLVTFSVPAKTKTKNPVSLGYFKSTNRY